MGTTRDLYFHHQFFCSIPTHNSAFGKTYPEGRAAEQGRRLRYTECSGTDRDPRRYWATDHVERGNCRGRGAAEGAVCVGGGGPGDPVCRPGAAGTGHCGRWLETTHRGSWRKCGAGRGADLDLWVHTAR